MKSVSFCRPMKRGEEPSVEALLKLAFDGTDEVTLVHQLRCDNVMAGEMVLPTPEGDIVGYYGLSAFKTPKGWLCLAPVAVHPDWQGQGHGRRMVGQCAAWAKAAKQYVVVVGDAEFYSGAGFEQARAQGLSAPYPPEHLLLAGPGEDAPQQVLQYPRAFGAL